MSDLVHFAPVRAWDRNGVAVPGAQARFFEPGTTTPRTVYANLALTTALPVPLVADARGVFPRVYTSGPIKVEMRDAAGVMLPGYPMDPAPVIASESSGARNVSFDPTGLIPVDDVQEAIERVDANWRAGLGAFGIGITGNAPLLPSFDATDIPGGVSYRFQLPTTTGVRPAEWASNALGIFWFHRRQANGGVAFAASTADGNLWRRVLSAGAWGDWARVGTPAADQAAWDTGTATDESSITPAKLRAATRAAVAATGPAPIFACRAWVNFNGTGTVSIRASGNVSSITDNGVGDYTVNFTANMPDANYAVSITGTGGNSVETIHIRAAAAGDAPTLMSNAAVRISSTGTDWHTVTVSIFR